MKTILVPTQNTPTMQSTLETAVLLAQRTGTYIQGVPRRSACLESATSRNIFIIWPSAKRTAPQSPRAPLQLPTSLSRRRAGYIARSWTDVRRCPRPKWVKLRSLSAQLGSPLYPQEQTSPAGPVRSEKVPQTDVAVAHTSLPKLPWVCRQPSHRRRPSPRYFPRERLERRGPGPLCGPVLFRQPGRRCMLNGRTSS